MGIRNRLDSGYCGLHHQWVFLLNHKSITSEKIYQKYELDLLNPRKKKKKHTGNNPEVQNKGVMEHKIAAAFTKVARLAPGTFKNNVWL